VCSWVVPGAGVKLSDGHLGYLLGALNTDLGVERGERDREVGHDRADAGVTGKEAVIAVVAFPGEAGVASL
jgi:hypothetical protein